MKEGLSTGNKTCILAGYPLFYAFMDTVISLRHQMAQQSAERGEEALELEAQGKTWAQIGDKFGVSRQRAGQILEAARKRKAKLRRQSNHSRKD